MDWFSAAANVASILGLGVSLGALYEIRTLKTSFGLELKLRDARDALNGASRKLKNLARTHFDPAEGQETAVRALVYVRALKKVQGLADDLFVNAVTNLEAIEKSNRVTRVDLDQGAISLVAVVTHIDTLVEGLKRK